MNSNQWDVLYNIFDDKTLVSHHIDSFNEFLDTSLIQIINEYDGANICDDVVVYLKNIRIQKPTHVESDGVVTLITPHEAKIRNLTYSSNIVIDINISTLTQEYTFNNCSLCKLPVMVKSKLCNLNQNYKHDECIHDHGGYFVVNGSEKVLIAQEKMNNNQVYIFSKKQPTKYSHVAELRSIKENDTKSTNTMFMYVTHTNAKCERFIRLQLASLKSEIPVFVFFFLLGYTNLEDVLVKLDNKPTYFKRFITNSVNECSLLNITNSEQAIEYLSSKFVYPNQTINVIINDIAYNNDSIESKSEILFFMIEQLIKCVLDKRAEDDRDHFKNKRIELAGHLYANLFRQLYRRTFKEFISISAKTINTTKVMNINHMLKTKIITNGLRYSLSTGNWGMGTSHNVRNGVSQVYNRLTYLSSVSHMRRINSPIGRDGKLTSPRHLHNSHWGKVCPAETPEGQTCGLVKNMSILVHVTTNTYSKPIKNIINYMLNNCEIEQSEMHKYSILVNGYMMGKSTNYKTIYNVLLAKKRNGSLSPDIGIACDDVLFQIRIHTDSGRICRPLFVIDQNTNTIPCLDPKVIEKIKNKYVTGYTWSYLISNGYIEYVDTDEEECLFIAMTPAKMKEDKYTHCEIHPSSIMGACATVIPFSDHNQSPRNTYQSAMGKQSIGISTTNFQERMDSISHILMYPQKPLVQTKMSGIMQLNTLPAGQNAIVAIASYSGYNQEDSVIMNKGSIDRGLFRSTFYRTYKEELKVQGGGIKETFEIPQKNECTGMKLASYSKLSSDGMVEPGTFIDGNEVLIGKTVTTLSQNDMKYIKRDVSTMTRHNEDGIVDKVMTTFNENGAKMVKIRVRKTRIPKIGDKVSARHGQKGTIGMIYNEEDMPFSPVDGIRPDIIINPHAIPSRMTVGQLLECLFGKLACMDGNIKDATAFNHNQDYIDDMYNNLSKHGFNRYGSDTLINGMTGKALQHAIFVGPTYYQRLKHMVDDKIHSRARGPVQVLTRQPVEGRSRDGGLRTGEMERDAVISHGAAMFMKDRLFYQSDAYRVHVCKNCGLFAMGDIKNNRFTCKSCTKPDVHQIEIPFATKLLFQELMSIGVTPRIF